MPGGCLSTTWKILLAYNTNNNGPRHEPGGTPQVSSKCIDIREIISLTETLNSYHTKRHWPIQNSKVRVEYIEKASKQKKRNNKSKCTFICSTKEKRKTATEAKYIPYAYIERFFFFFNEGHFIFVRFQEDLMKYCWVYFRHNFCINQHTDSSHAHNKKHSTKATSAGPTLVSLFNSSSRFEMSFISLLINSG